MNNLSVDNEFRYVVKWFNEWSELQREDFVPILADYVRQQETANGGEHYVNGVVHAVSNVCITDKPMSLFQCRIKLFREWSPKWPAEFKSKLQEKIIELDPKIGELITEALKGPNGTADLHMNGKEASDADEAEAHTIVETVAAATEEAVAAEEWPSQPESAVSGHDDEGKAQSVEAAAEAEQVLEHTEETVDPSAAVDAPLLAADITVGQTVVASS